MLQLTRKTEYGLIALNYLSQRGNEVCSAREIADGCNIPLPLLMNILKLLSQQGIVSSSRGARGGYQLSLAAEDVTLANAILAIEGPIKLMRCVNDKDDQQDYENGCERSARCAIRSSLLKIHDEIESLLSHITLADIAGDSRSPVKILANQEEIDEAYLP